MSPEELTEQTPGRLSDEIEPGACCWDPVTRLATAEERPLPANTCCGTRAEADAAGKCCGAAAKEHAIASGATCCG
jgi:hypothetical protein